MNEVFQKGFVISLLTWFILLFASIPVSSSTVLEGSGVLANISKSKSNITFVLVMSLPSILVEHTSMCFFGIFAQLYENSQKFNLYPSTALFVFSIHQFVLS